MSVLVPDSAQLPVIVMRIKLHLVDVPRRELSLRIASIRSTRRGIPCPNFVRVNWVEISFQLSAYQVAEIAYEITINIVRVVFVLDKRSVHVDFVDPDLLKLACHDG
jgi:hypothetical protein